MERESFIMNKSVFIILLALLIVISCKSSTEPGSGDINFQNGDFEVGTTSPSYWEIYSPDLIDMRWQYDTISPYSGEKCVSSSRRSGYSLTNKFTYFRQLITNFSPERDITFSGYIRVIDIEEGTAAFAIEFLDEDDEIEKIVATDKFIDGNKGWRKYSISSEIPSTTVKIYVYCIHDGDGEAWFDSTAVIFE